VGPDSEKRTWDIKQGVRLSAIFFLTQAAEDEVVPAGTAMASVILADAAMTIFHSVQARPNPMEKSPLFSGVFDNAATMANSVPSYVLRLSLEGRFWEKIEKVLEKEKGDSPLLQCETRGQKTA
jgi:SynChlorMet cassette protein ScmC